jgi:hypothetical protein
MSARRSRTRPARDRRIRRMVARLLAHWQAATAADLAAGRAWYRRARAAVGRIADASGIPPPLVAGVVAALSPRCKWRINVVWAARLCFARAAGCPCPPVGIGHCRAKAWAIAGGADPADVLRGPKVTRFWACLTGGPGCGVAVDVWAARAACGRAFNGRAPADRHYLDIERAYQLAAAVAGMSARDFQAAIWVHIRGGAE